MNQTEYIPEDIIGYERRMQYKAGERGEDFFK